MHIRSNWPSVDTQAASRQSSHCHLQYLYETLKLIFLGISSLVEPGVEYLEETDEMQSVAEPEIILELPSAMATPKPQPSLAPTPKIIKSQQNSGPTGQGSIKIQNISSKHLCFSTKTLNELTNAAIILHNV